MTLQIAGRATDRALRPLRHRLVRARTRGWPPHTRLFVVGDRAGWSIDDDVVHLTARAERLGYRVGPGSWARACAHQSVVVASHFSALHPEWLDSSHRLATSWFHGRPGTPGHPEFDTVFETLRRHPDRLMRIHVTHGEMRDLVLSAGVPAERVALIPIGIDLEQFPLGGSEERSRARAALGLPASAFVVGSFQKDGRGWEEGLEPKLVKGPDVLVDALARLRERVPELTVLLTGPARGFVRRELERHGIAHRHVHARSRAELARAYRALDAYVVASRQEGGPKAALESLASGVPLVSTRVGQVPEIVTHGRDGLLVDVEDVEAIAAACVRVHDDPALVSRLREHGRATAESYAHEKLDVRWAPFLAALTTREDGRP
jgi:glycosyltransferase involved in cell wall biosynthesis